MRFCVPERSWSASETQFVETYKGQFLSPRTVHSVTLGIIHLVRKQKFPKTNISNPLIHIRTCAYQGVRIVSFSENFAHVLNEWCPEWINWSLLYSVKTDVVLTKSGSVFFIRFIVGRKIDRKCSYRKCTRSARANFKFLVTKLD